MHYIVHSMVHSMVHYMVHSIARLRVRGVAHGLGEDAEQSRVEREHLQGRQREGGRPAADHGPARVIEAADGLIEPATQPLQAIEGDEHLQQYAGLQAGMRRVVGWDA